MSESEITAESDISQGIRLHQKINIPKSATTIIENHKLRSDKKSQYEKPYIFIYSKEDKDFWCD
jgi:hypothetical protein